MEYGIITKKLDQIEEYIPNDTNYRIRLDANESPFTPSPEIIEEFAEALKSIDFNRYPDPMAQRLLDEYADAHRINSENLVAGNGSDELISLICGGFIDPGDNITVLSPDFSMYEFYGKYAGAKVNRFKKDEIFDYDLDELAKYVNLNRSKILIFSNPCNPTGMIKNRMELEIFIRKINAHTLIVIDEAYMEFASDEKAQSMFKMADYFDNLIVLRTLSKAYGSAAMRIGFAAANPKIIAGLRKVKSPYNVNAISQEFARIMIRHRAETAEKVKLIQINLLKLSKGLAALDIDSIRVLYPSLANFQLVGMKTPEDAVYLTEQLKARGISIRCFESMSCVRISAGTEEEIDELLHNIEEIYS